MSAGHSLDVKASPETVWSIWSDPAHWAEWNANVKSMEMSGPFAIGTEGTMHTDTGRHHHVKLVSVTPNRSFRLDATPLPATLFHFDCSIEPLADGSRISQGVSISGLLGVFGSRIAERVSGTFPALLEGLRKKAEAAEAAKGGGATQG